MEYINHIKSKARSSKSPPKSQTPVLTDEDEAFLDRVVSGQSQDDSSTPTVGRDAQLALMDGAQDIPLPESPKGSEEEEEEQLSTELRDERGGENTKENEGPATTSTPRKKRKLFSWIGNKKRKV